MSNLNLSNTRRRLKNAIQDQSWAYIKHRAQPACLKIPALLVFAFFLQPLSMFGQFFTPSPKAVRTFRTCDFIANQAARPDNPALRISRSVVDYVDERLMDHNKAVTAGMASSKEIQQVVPAPAPANEWFSHPSVFAEYDYIYSNN